MKIINLSDLEKSEIKYKISKFPDGQQNIVINTHILTNGEVWIGTKDLYFRTDEVKILSHLNNWLHLELIVATVACLRELGVTKIHLATPYFVGARSDRKFEEGGNWYLKQVICPVINNLNLTSVLVLDPHSWILGNLIANFRFVDNTGFVKWAVRNLISDKLDKTNLIGSVSNDFIFISPDAGASHKIQKVADALNYTSDIITCTKERNTEGKLTKTFVPLHPQYAMKDFIIIDDICDGGRTFINIAVEIKKVFPDAKIYLFVTHGIFSAGFEELSKYFECIYCTNSYSDIGILASKWGELVKTNVKQLNVF